MSVFEYRSYTECDSLETAVRIPNTDAHQVVAAARHEGGFIPGYYDCRTKVFQFPWGCKAHVRNEFYVFHKVEGPVWWEEGQNGHVGRNAVETGVAESGEALYTGAFKRNGKWICGKVHRSHGVCYVPDEGKEICNSTYIVLCAAMSPDDLQTEEAFR